VDLTKFKMPDWLIVGGGAVVFLFGFFDWFDTGSVSSSAFKFTLTGVIPWLLIVGSALLAFQIRTGLLRTAKWPWPMIFMAATGLGTLLILVRLILGADADDFIAGAPDVSVRRKFTLWLCFLGGLAATAGAFMSFTMAGGKLNDLPLIGRLRAGRSASLKRGRSRPPAPDSTTDSGSGSGSHSARRLPPAEQDRPFEDPEY
jgi:hypothetical protein